ncbi:MAG: CBS domain-containing protein [Bdellovibrionaceae bacterium]|nr:CBS domain-containing protein [Bdellovibrio sp.]
MQVRDIMTKNVETVHPDTLMVEVAKKMKELDVGMIPVMQGSKVLGLITDRDIVLCVVAEGKNASECCAHEIISGVPITIMSSADVEDAADLMEQRQIRRLIVVDESETFCGILSLGDIATRLDQQRAGEALEKISEPSHLAQ